MSILNDMPYHEHEDGSKWLLGSFLVKETSDLLVFEHRCLQCGEIVKTNERKIERS